DEDDDEEDAKEGEDDREDGVMGTRRGAIVVRLGHGSGSPWGLWKPLHYSGAGIARTVPIRTIRPAFGEPDVSRSPKAGRCPPRFCEPGLRDCFKTGTVPFVLPDPRRFGGW